MKVYSLLFLELKPRKFQYHKESNALVTWYWYLWAHFLPHTNTGVGYCLFVVNAS